MPVVEQAAVTRAPMPLPMEAVVVVAVPPNRVNGLRRAPNNLYFTRRMFSMKNDGSIAGHWLVHRSLRAGAAPGKGSASFLFLSAELKKRATPGPVV